MTPKEKAEELIEKYYSLYEGIELSLARKHWARRSALIAVNEILSVIWINLDDEVDYWAEVKQEIEKL